MTATATSELPPALQGMGEDELVRLKELVDKKAWFRASTIEPFTKREQKAIKDARRHSGKRGERRAKDRFYKRHHWNSLRWFLFGGLVDLPGLPADPERAYDPEHNPWLKVHVPGWVYTLDEHDEADPYKLLPDKDYLRLLAYAWVHEPLLVTPKSRQVMVTWLFCSIAAHSLLVRPGQKIAIISKKFDDADALLDRSKGVLERLPQDRFYIPQARKISGELSVVERDSMAMAMGEEAKGLRQYTFSWIFSDEMAFQDQADEMVRAALATVRGGGRFTGVSTSNGEEVFYNIVSENGRIPTPPGG